MQIETKILECPTEDCDRDRVSKTLATFVSATPHCPDCGAEL